MQEFLSGMTGKQLDVLCMGGANLRGEVVKVEVGLLHLKDEEGHMSYVALDKVIVVWEVREDEPRPGFITTRNSGFVSKPRK